MNKDHALSKITAEEVAEARAAGFLTLDEARTKYIKHVLRYTGGNVRRAAVILNCSRTTIHRHLRETPDDHGETLS